MKYYKAYIKALNDPQVKKLIKWWDNGGKLVLSHDELKKLIIKIGRDAK